MTDQITHAIMNHLWQSTLFAVAAGLLTLALRKNGAHTRHWLWCAASYKFLIPFSMLTAAGSYFSWRSAPVTPLPPVLDQFVQPFSTSAVVVPVMPVSPAPSATLNPVWVWMAIWACGTFAVGIYWMVRWLRIRAAVRSAAPLPMSVDVAIPVRSSRMLIEPGVVGFFRPVLLLPEGISERLTPQQLKTILTHEICHMRRRDNLTAAIHMLVEALFWFHPLVWWLGVRMIVEREAACDEAVIASGNDREAYAEALLTVCKFYVESPLASAAGVSGADLKKRIFLIMTGSVARKLDFGKKLLLGAAGLAAVAVPVVFGLANAHQTRAESRPENTDVTLPTASGPANPTHSRGQSLAENKTAAPAGDIGKYIAGLGTVTPVNTVSVTSRVQGQIMDVRYTEGQMVHKGDPLLDIDPRPYQAALTQMEGQLARDQAVLNEARINANGGQQSGFQSQTVEQDEGAVQIDQGKVQIARVNLEYCHISSPIEGRVGLRLVDPGNLVQANGTTPLVVVTQVQPITVIFNVAEDRLPQIERQLRQGQRLAVDVFDRTETKKFASGYLLASDNRIDTDTGTVKLRAIFPNADSSLFPNQFVNVRMESGPATQAAQSQDTGATTPAPDWQAEGGKMAFDVASVKQNTAAIGPQTLHSNIPLGPQEASISTGGLISSTDWPLSQYMAFAYKLTPSQVRAVQSQLPKWANNNRYDIQARASGNPNEDQFRLMVQALLADRFKLVIHHETRQLPIMALVLDKPGKLGPQLQEHPEVSPCSDTPLAPNSGPVKVPTIAGGFPMICGMLANLPPTAPGRARLGARSVPMSMITILFNVSQVSGVDRPIVDKTGLTGKADFVMEFALDYSDAKGPLDLMYIPIPAGTPPPPDPTAPTFLEALKEQLGLKLESQTGPVDVLVLDHVEEPSEN